MNHSSEHATVKTRIREKVHGTYGKEPVSVVRLSPGASMCSCEASYVRQGGIFLMYDKGGIVWSFAYCRNCNKAWYTVPISREEADLIMPACRAKVGNHLGAMVAHAVVMNDRTGEVVDARTIYKQPSDKGCPHWGEITGSCEVIREAGKVFRDGYQLKQPNR